MAQSDIPIPLSQPQILGNLIDGLTSRIGIKKLKVGNPLLSTLETVSQTTAKASYDQLKGLQSNDVDNTTGIALQNIGAREKVYQKGPVAATSTVTVTDTSFQKISSNIYHGASAPIAGSSTINVDKTDSFAAAPSSGNIYIGRGTSQAEGPVAYTAKTDNGTYWTLSFSSPTAVFHNLGEQVILGQGGDRAVNAGQIVSTAPGVLSSPVEYSVVVGGTIPDGEVTLAGIQIVCTQLGSVGNVPENTITEFGGSPPFTGASVTNPATVSSGRDTETTQQYRDRIKAARNTRQGGSDLAIKNAVINVKSTDEQKTVLSSSILRRKGRPSILTIDDGNGYEPISTDVGYEVVRDSATGGETDFVTVNKPIEIASLKTTFTAPFNLISGTSIWVQVGNQTVQQHVFDTSLFNEPTAASAYDVADSINSNTSLKFAARTSDNATKVVIYPKNEEASIQCVSGEANEVLGFPSAVAYTSLLYKNDRLLHSSLSEYSLDRATGAFTLADALAQGDKLTFGTIWSRGFVESAVIDTINLAADQDIWAVLDGMTSIIDSGKDVVSSLIVSVYRVTPSAIQLLVSNTNNFSSNVAVGDSLLLYTTGTNQLPAALNGPFKIIAKPASNRVVIETPQMKSARKLGAACNFPASDNKVLICGGLCAQNTGVLDSVDIFNVTTGEFTVGAKMAYARYGHSATLLNNGKILIVGGFGADGAVVTQTELYDTTTGEWGLGPSYANSAAFHSTTTLPSNNILITGGLAGTRISSTAVNYSIEYNPTSNVFENASTFYGARFSHTDVLNSTDVFQVGGMSDFDDPMSSSTSIYSAANKYDTSTHSWTSVTSPVNVTPTAKYRNFTAALYATNAIVAIDNHNLHTYAVLTDTWTSYGDVAAVSDFANAKIYNGTSLQNEGIEPSDPYSYFGRTNPLIKTASGIVGMLFAEYTDTTTDIRTPRHFYYDSETNKFVSLINPASSFTISGCKSMYMAVPLNGTGNTHKIAIFGGQNEDAHYSGGEESICSTVEVLDLNSKTISYPTPLDGTYSGIQGWVVYSTNSPTSRGVIPAASNYTAQTLAPAIVMPGLQSSTYRTSKVRLSTNGLQGSLTLLGSTVASLTSEEVYASGICLSGTVKSTRTELDIPADFTVFSVGSVEGSSVRLPATLPSLPGGLPATTPSKFVGRNIQPPLNATVCGLTKKNFGEGDATNLITSKEWSNAQKEIAKIGTYTASGSFAVTESSFADSVLLAAPFNISICPNQPVYCGLPFLFSKNDRLNVTIDADLDSRVDFNIPMARKLVPSNSVYSQQVALKDGDNANSFLARSFGPDYDFANFGLLMRARTLVDGMLYRFCRYGEEGENYAVRYLYPTVQNASAAVSVNYGYLAEPNAFTYDQISLIDITLPSGNKFENITINPTSKLSITRGVSNNGVCRIYLMVGMKVISCVRDTIGGETTLTVTFPDSHIPTDSHASNVFTVGQFIRFDAVTPTPTTLQSGQTYITHVGTVSGADLEIKIAAESLDDGTSTMPLTNNPGTISFDPTEQNEVKFNSSIAVNDIVYLKSPLHFHSNPMRVVGTGISYQYLECKALDLYPSNNDSYLDTIIDRENILIFDGPTATKTALAASINALAAVDSSTCPITATVITGGSSPVTLASWDNGDNWESAFLLKDGFNAVASTIKPANINTDTQVVFKKTIDSSLASSSDWGNEILYLVPSYASDVVKWLNTPCITGLWTRAKVETADSGTSVQVTSNSIGSSSSVQISGSAVDTSATITGVEYQSPSDSVAPFGVVTIKTSDANNFIGGQFAKIVNTKTTQKAYPNSSNTLHYITSEGIWITTSGLYQTRLANRLTTTASIEKLGGFVLIKLAKTLDGSEIVAGDYLYLSEPGTPSFTTDLEDVSANNCGIFKIVAIDGNNSMFIIENPSFVTEKAVLDVQILSGSSIVPGDIINVNDNRFGIGNKSSWVVEKVGTSGLTGKQFISNTLVVSIREKAPQVLNSSVPFTASSVQVKEGSPGIYYKKILGISPNSSDGTLTDIKLQGDITGISVDVGSVISSLNKLEFPSGKYIGRDGYRYNVGLVGECNKVIYGDESDPQTYPGVVSNGASVLTDGPVIKRAKVTLAAKITGDPNEDIADKIRSVVAGYINSCPHGQNIPYSKISEAAQRVDRVISAKALNNQDEILVSSQEKLMVLNLRADISVVFYG